MGITRKKDEKVVTATAAPPVDEKQINALIEKGGSVTQVNRKEVKEEKNHAVMLKVPKPLMNDLDEELKYLPTYFRKHRTLYILQAIEEKILRDRKKRK